MEKIVKAALTAKFTNVNIEHLIEIINATPNAVIATEIMLGVYSEPEIAHKRVDSKSSEGILTFKSYNKWDDRVYYSYTWEEKRNDYFPLSVKKEDVTLENFDSLRCKYKEGEVHTISVLTGKTLVKESYCPLSRWNTYSYAPAERELEINKQENLYSCD